MVGDPAPTLYPHWERVMCLLSIKADLRAKAIASLTWAMVTDASGQMAETTPVENGASKGKTAGRTLPRHPDVPAARVHVAHLARRCGGPQAAGVLLGAWRRGAGDHAPGVPSAVEAAPEPFETKCAASSAALRAARGLASAQWCLALRWCGSHWLRSGAAPYRGRVSPVSRGEPRRSRCFHLSRHCDLRHTPRPCATRYRCHTRLPGQGSRTGPARGTSSIGQAIPPIHADARDNTATSRAAKRATSRTSRGSS